jgi:hypothetical protein
MKKIITFIALLVMLASCGATKKAIKTTETQLDSLTVAKVVSEQTEKVVDTTRTEHGKVTITEIEFFPPTEIEQPQPEHDKPKDSDNKVADEPKKTQPTTTASVDLANVGKVQGAVKSIKQTVIESDVEEKGKSEESSESNETESAATVTKTTESTDKNQEPTPDPYRWRYIFFIALLGVALLLYLKRTPIVNWIRKILSGILKIL